MKKKAGALTVEASILVPVAFVVLLPFLFIIRTVYIYDAVQSAAMDTAGLMSTVFYLSEKLPESGELEQTVREKAEAAVQTYIPEYQGFLDTLSGIAQEYGAGLFVKNLALQQVARFFCAHLLQDREMLEQGIRGGTGRISYVLSDFFLEKGGRTDLFRMTLLYELTFPFNSRFATLRPVLVSATARKFLGVSLSGHGSDGAQSAQEDISGVYYRIQNGTHYHTASCYLIDKTLHTLSLQEAKAQGYTACSYCKDQVGQVVVITHGGTRYHAPNCYHIGSQISILTWDEICQGGYQPCQICIGGGTWFG